MRVLTSRIEPFDFRPVVRLKYESALILIFI